MGEVSDAFSIVEVREVSSGGTLVAGLPDVGLVGAISASYLVKRLEMQEVGYIDSDKLPPVLVFHDERPTMPIRMYERDGVVVLISEVPIPAALMPELAKTVVGWAERRGLGRLVVLGGIPVPNRIDIEKPEVIGVGVLDSDRELLKKLGIEVLKEGFLAGSYALIAKECLRRGVPCVALLAQSYLQYPDPGAAAAVLETLSKIIDIEIDVKPLLDQEEEVRVKLRELMRRTLPVVRQAQKGYEYTTPLMYA